MDCVKQIFEMMDDCTDLLPSRPSKQYELACVIRRLIDTGAMGSQSG